jgi:hypothetical protein
MNEKLEPPRWVAELSPETLKDLWLARYGRQWVTHEELEGDDFYYVALKLVDSRSIEWHQRLSDPNGASNISSKISVVTSFKIPEQVAHECKS